MYDFPTILAFAAFVLLAGYLAGRLAERDRWAAAARRRRPVRWRGSSFWVVESVDRRGGPDREA